MDKFKNVNDPKVQKRLAAKAKAAKKKAELE